MPRLTGYGVDFADAVELRGRVARGENWLSAAVAMLRDAASPPECSVARPSIPPVIKRNLRASALLRMSHMLDKLHS